MLLQICTSGRRGKGIFELLYNGIISTGKGAKYYCKLLVFIDMKSHTPFHDVQVTSFNNVD